MPDLVSAEGQAPSTLPDVPDKKLLERYRSRVEGGKKWREDEGYDDAWKRLRDLYRLKHYETSSGRDRIAVAITFATVNVIAPSVAVNNPKFTAWARSEDPDIQNKAVISEAVLNYWWKHHRFHQPFRRIVKDYIIYGIGWGKTAWRYEEEQVDRDPAEIDAEFQMAVEQADAYAVENPDLAADLPDDEAIRSGIETKATEVTEDRPVLERVSPLDVIVDPLATSKDDWAWVAQRVVRHLEEVKRDDRYEERARKRLEADGSVPWHAKDSTSADTSKAESEMITLWEFYDMKRRTVCVFAEGKLNEFLVKPTDMPYSFGCPLEPLTNYEVPDQFLSIGDIEAIEPLQRELDQTRTQMVEARKLDLPKFFYRKGRLSAAAINALKSDEAYTGIPVDDDEPFEELIQPIPRPSAPIQPQLYQHSEAIETDIDLVSGISEYQRGATAEISRTATEASIIQDAANARAADKLDGIEKFLAEIGGRILALGKQYMTGEEAARIVNDQGAAIYWSFTADDIDDELDVEVEAGSTQPRNETFRRQQAQQLMNVLSPMLGTGILNDAQVIMHVLRDGFGVKQPEQFLGPMGMQLAMGQMPMGMGEEEPPPEGGEEEQQPADPLGGTDAVPDAQLNQLAGQIGYSPNTLGGGALGPGSAA